jgi:deazaflavin-dependent oxidoreductase (nitroreductase family)
MSTTHADPTDQTSDPHYQAPGWLTRNVVNRLVARLTRMGVSVWGSRVLEVPGRSTGEPRRTPVNLLEVDGVRYLVSARGDGQWVRNVRANGGRLALLLGSGRTEHLAQELEGDEKVVVLREYLRRWKAEVGAFFDGASADSSDDELRAIAHRHPAFSLHDADR